MIDYSLYPSDWKTKIRPDILQRANNCCEVCGVKNYSVGARTDEGVWMDELHINNLNSDVGDGLFSKGFPKIIKIVLTVAHLDHDINNNDYSNLKALCQKCHFGHDRNDNKLKKKLRKYKGSLFPCE